MSQFTFHTIENTDGEAKTLLEDIHKQYGFIPNLYAYMAEAPITIKAYLAMMELLKQGIFSPSQLQVALLAASAANECDFCTTVHRALGKMSGANQQTLDALHSGSTISDDSDRALATFVQKMVNERGHLKDEAINAFLEAGFNKQHIMEVTLIVSTKTLSNYINHLTKTESNQELINML